MVLYIRIDKSKWIHEKQVSYLKSRQQRAGKLAVNKFMRKHDVTEFKSPASM